MQYTIPRNHTRAKLSGRSIRRAATGGRFGGFAGPPVSFRSAHKYNGRQCTWTTATNVFTVNGAYANCSVPKASWGGSSYYLPRGHELWVYDSQFGGDRWHLSRSGALRRQRQRKGFQDQADYEWVLGTTDRSAGAAWPTASATNNFGSSADTWGTNWSYAAINAASFGVALSCTNNGNAARAAHVDSMRMTVYYRVPPTVDNEAATDVTASSASLGGNVISTGGAPTYVWLFWGTNDGGTAAGQWQTSGSFGIRGQGLLSTNITGLAANRTYYCRCYATNSAGTNWAGSTTNFLTAKPAVSLSMGTNSRSGGKARRQAGLWIFWVMRAGCPVRTFRSVSTP
mgnify:CR=1 FL=1